MNLRQRPQTNPTLTALPVGPTQRTPRLSQLSARQLFDVELGLCLLAAISPSASPATLPDLLIDGTAPTAKQRRSLDKARLMLAQLTQPSRPDGTRSLWADLLDRYARLPHDTQAFDISCDGNRFSPKSVGFFRNRVRTLTHLLA
ncbi:hypothetical protein ACAW74_08585 [Fibrella sp. WM1]|uniref:pPIWI_RE_Z domain-containing protein n=1 Tax=Fibrella musci TaxID=3242485 RepID=UPI0035228D60